MVSLARQRSAAASASRSWVERLWSSIAERGQSYAKEQGKPLNGMGSRFELGGVQAWTHHTADIPMPVKVLQDNNEGRIELHRKAIGVVGSITPWNWPLIVATWHIIPAIAVGNTVVNKPSPYTPLSTLARQSQRIRASARLPSLARCAPARK